MIALQPGRNTMQIEPFAERPALGGSRRPRRQAVKPHQLAQHRPKTRPQQIAPLREQGGQAMAAIFQPAMIQRHGERHAARLRGNIQMPEQRRQIRIGRLVINDEAHIHRHGPGFCRHIHRIAMATGQCRLFVERYAVPAAKQPRAGKSRDAAAHHRNIQRAARGMEPVYRAAVADNGQAGAVRRHIVQSLPLFPPGPTCLYGARHGFGCGPVAQMGMIPGPASI